MVLLAFFLLLYYLKGIMEEKESKRGLKEKLFLLLLSLGLWVLFHLKAQSYWLIGGERPRETDMHLARVTSTF